MKTPGKIVIVLILAVALGMAGFSVWHRRNGMRHAMEFWGPQRALLLQRADSITLCFLVREDADVSGTTRSDRADDAGAKQEAGAESTASTVLIDSHAFRVGPPVSILASPGVLHLQTYLIEDRSYDWAARPEATDAWSFLLTFSDGQDQLRLAVTADAAQILCLDTAARAETAPLAPFLLDVLSRVERPASP